MHDNNRKDLYSADRRDFLIVDLKKKVIIIKIRKNTLSDNSRRILMYFHSSPRVQFDDSGSRPIVQTTT